MNPLARVRALTGTTPGLYRVASLAVAAVLVVTAVVATFAANSAEGATSRLRDNTGPVLVATQSLLASLAEAEAAATAAFLSGGSDGGSEDREQRRLYEEALSRANVQAEEISALIGDDEAAHTDLKSLGIRMTRYAGLIEAARASLRAGAAGSEQYLLAALDLLATGVRSDVAGLTSASERRLDRDEGRRGSGVVLAAVVGATAMFSVVVASVLMTRRSRRLVNPFLALAGVLLVAAIGWLVAVHVRSGDELADARHGGYESIALTAEIQSEAFAGKAAESVALIASDPNRRAQADAAIDRLSGAVPVTSDIVDQVRAGNVPDGDGLLFDAAREADTPRERAAVAEMLVRWQRYRDSVEQVRTASGDEAKRLAIGPASATFNGFNFSVESVLADNRDQFLEGVASADDRSGTLSTVTLALPLLAAAAALVGFQLRINEYR